MGAGYVLRKCKENSGVDLLPGRRPRAESFPFSLQFWKGPERHLLRTSSHGSSADLQWTGGGGVGVCKPCDSSHQILGLQSPGKEQRCTPCSGMCSWAFQWEWNAGLVPLGSVLFPSSG